MKQEVEIIPANTILNTSNKYRFHITTTDHKGISLRFCAMQNMLLQLILLAGNLKVMMSRYL